MNDVTTRPRRINLGCGASPTEGWYNYDNSITVRLARYPTIIKALQRWKLLSADQQVFAKVAQNAKIEWANVTKHIPAADNSVEIVYSSHMFEHLDRSEAQRFLQEVLRVLVPAGIIRLAVPDIARLIRLYEGHHDADSFISSTHLTRNRPHRLLDRLRWAVVGERGHLWMYDGASLSALLLRAGFISPKVLSAGETTIPKPGNLDLHERDDESVYVEARKA